MPGKRRIGRDFKLLLCVTLAVFQTSTRTGMFGPRTHKSLLPLFTAERARPNRHYFPRTARGASKSTGRSDKTCTPCNEAKSWRTTSSIPTTPAKGRRRMSKFRSCKRDRRLGEKQVGEAREEPETANSPPCHTSAAF